MDILTLDRIGHIVEVIGTVTIVLIGTHMATGTITATTDSGHNPKSIRDNLTTLLEPLNLTNFQDIIKSAFCELYCMYSN